MQFYNDYSDSQKKYFRIGAGLALLGVVAALFAVAVFYVVDAKQTLRSSAASRIDVTGEGRVLTKPDIAVVNVTVTTERPTVSEAQQENTDSYNKVIAFLEKSGVDSKDVKTTNYSIYPQYFYPTNRKPEITGYQVRNMLEIKIRDLRRVDDILGGVVANGANEIGGVTFTIENPDMVKNQARKIAIDIAKAKAGTLSKDLGVRLKRIVSFTESDGNAPPLPIYYASEIAGKGGGGGPNLQQGEQEVKVFVTITYEFRSR